MEIPLLKDIVIILGLSMVVVYISHRLKLPVVVGLLVTGVLAGPHALGLINAVDEVDKLAKIGVILLLFTIGIEFSLRKLMRIKMLVLVGGGLQVGLTVAAVYFFTRHVTGWEFGPAMFMGFLISLSSTAIVLKVLQDRAEIDTPFGRTALGILIFQDVIVVLFIILTPFLAGHTAGDDSSLLRLAAVGLGLILFVYFGARYIIPAVLYQVVRTRSTELFLLTVAAICFAVAFLAAELSLALGAFLAGLAISESEYSHEALEHITPFRDIFTAFFFVSIGMLLDIGFVFQQPLLILLIALGIMALKTVVVTLTSLTLGYPLHTGLRSGLSLSQVGEFAFILAGVGSSYALLTAEAEQTFLAVSIISMAATPFIIAQSGAVANLLQRLRLPEKLQTGLYPVANVEKPDTSFCYDHLLIIGYGINGRNVARGAARAGIPYAILETNADTVRREQADGEHIFYGDATQPAVLAMVNVTQARTVVIAIADAAATRSITALVHRLSPAAHIIARTRYIREMEPLYRLGASQVIPEEFETSVEIITRVLSRYLVPQEQIAHLVAEVRADGYQMFRSLSQAANISVSDLHHHLHGIEISPIYVPEGSPFSHKSLAEIDLRAKTGLTLLAIRRNDSIVTGIDADTVIEPKDELFVMGSHEQVAIAALQIAE